MTSPASAITGVSPSAGRPRSPASGIASVPSPRPHSTPSTVAPGAWAIRRRSMARPVDVISYCVTRPGLRQVIQSRRANASATGRSSTARRTAPSGLSRRTTARSIAAATAKTAPGSHKRRKTRMASDINLASSSKTSSPCLGFDGAIIFSPFPDRLSVSSSETVVVGVAFFNRPSAQSIKKSSRRFSKRRTWRSTVEACNPSSRAIWRRERPLSVWLRYNRAAGGTQSGRKFTGFR